MIEDRSVDLLYLASNRLEFTRETFLALLRNTDWRYVRELVVNDNNSVDGTREWLAQRIRESPVPIRFVKGSYTSPVAAMNYFIETAQVPILAKIDNDAVVPPGWLRQSLEVVERHPELSLLGIEAMYPVSDDPQLVRSYVPAQFISGLGLYRRAAFARSRPTPIGKYFGLEEWQMAYRTLLVRGWINPALPLFLLDRIPFEPWLSLSKKYVEFGWQRDWQKYDPNVGLWKWRWSEEPMKPLVEELNCFPENRDADSRFLCALRIKNEALHIREVLTQALRLCSRAYVFDDHSTDDTVSICESFGPDVTVFRSPFSGLDEARDKNFLLEKIIRADPEWVLWIDGDEVLESCGPEQIRAWVAQSPTTAVCYLQIAYLWDDPQQVRVDGLFGKFHRQSLFRLRGQPKSRLRFQLTGRHGNFHCGNVPVGIVGEHRYLPVRLKHYGYLTQQQRAAKCAFYMQTDPGNHLEDNYRHLLGIPGARYAPGPVQLAPWVESMPKKKTPHQPEPLSEAVANAWLQLLKKTLVRYPLDDGELEMSSRLSGVDDSLRTEIERWLQFNRRGQLHESGRSLADRATGRDWPATAETMLGLARMDNLHACLTSVIQSKVPGDFVEVGVWRGGAGILMRALLMAFQDFRRKVWLADSFRGYPAPDPNRYPADKDDPHRLFAELAVPIDTVKKNFERYGMLDEQVQFLPGWFRDTLAAAPIKRVAVLHLDVDMYESTMLALLHLYPKVASAGYVIIDDYGALAACRQAVDDFRREFQIKTELREIDWTGVFWQV